MVSFPPVSPPRPYTPPSPHPYASHAQPTWFFSILSSPQYWVRSTNHLAPRYASLFIHSCINSTLLSSSVDLSTLFYKTLSLCSPFHVRDHVLHQYFKRKKYSSVFHTVHSVHYNSVVTVRTNERTHTRLLKPQHYNTPARTCFQPHWPIIRDHICTKRV